MSYARSRSARLVSSNEVSSASVHFTDFYREEFIRHRQCLEAQREYFSEQAIKARTGRWLWFSDNWTVSVLRRMPTP